MARKRLMPKFAADLPPAPEPAPTVDGQYEHAILTGATLAAGAILAPRRVPDDLREELLRCGPGLLAHLDARLGQLAQMRDAGMQAAIHAPVRAQEPEGTIPQALLKEVFLLSHGAFNLIHVSCQLTGINPKRVRTWMAHDPEFAEDVADAEAIYNSRIEQVLQRRIMDPDAKADKASALLLIFYLNAHKPHLYKPQGAPAPVGTPQMSLDIGIDNPYLTASVRDVTPVRPALLPAPATEPIVEGEFRETQTDG